MAACSGNPGAILRSWSEKRSQLNSWQRFDLVGAILASMGESDNPDEVRSSRSSKTDDKRRKGPFIVQPMGTDEHRQELNDAGHAGQRDRDQQVQQRSDTANVTTPGPHSSGSQALEAMNTSLATLTDEIRQAQKLQSVMQNASDRDHEPVQSNSGTRNRERYASRPSISDDEGDEGEQEDGPPPAKRALFSGDDESVMGLEDVQKFLDDQQVGDGAGIELVEDDMLGEYAQGLQLTDKVGDDITEPLANLLSSMLTKRMDEAGLVKKAELYPRPSNLPPLVTPTVNVEIWDQIQKGTRSRDIKMQKGQNSTVKGLSALTKLAGVLLEAKNKKTAVSVPECLRICLDAFALFANGNQEFNSRRKESIKPDLKVQGLSKEHRNHGQAVW